MILVIDGGFTCSVFARAPSVIGPSRYRVARAVSWDGVAFSSWDPSWRRRRASRATETRSWDACWGAETLDISLAYQTFSLAKGFLQSASI
jgi:hypothetical protein